MPALLTLAVAAAPIESSAGDRAHRELLAQAVIESDAARQLELLKPLLSTTDDLVIRALNAWRSGELYLQPGPDDRPIPILLDSQRDDDGRARGIRIVDGEFVRGDDGEPLRWAVEELTMADTSSRLRRSIRSVLDLHAIGNPNPRMRRDAIVKVGQQQNAEYLPFLRERLDGETDQWVQKALREAISLTEALDSDPAVRVAAIRSLTDLRSINALDFLKGMQREAISAPDRFDAETKQALHSAIRRIEEYIWWGNLIGTVFRGLSLAAVLLVAALGLAITFGLMGVINMAHGEIILVGAYTAYLTQNVFVRWFGASGPGFDLYIIAALGASFVMAALVGLALERGVIRFLYRRPLESLLATWGVSLVLQQLFRHTFGAANVQVNSPAWLSGSFVIHDVLFAYNRLFIVGFALFIVLVTWLLLTRTSLGLQIRAVMQNRAMASCMGVRTNRVNAMTFAFGSGLAGLAGACLSQIANVGPGLGQSYIVDCFMIVVLGGVGNLIGTVSASFGVGLTNQILEPWLGAVLGKITVLVAIILFLQWRPAGLFATRSRALEG
jgi:urea transport system permease protein